MKSKKKNHHEMDLNDLASWLDERGFNLSYEALDFIESSIPRRVKRDIVRHVKSNYNQIIKDLE